MYNGTKQGKTLVKINRNSLPSQPDLTGFHGAMMDQVERHAKGSADSRHDETCQVFYFFIKKASQVPNLGRLPIS
jgi:hypothetical protein